MLGTLVCRYISAEGSRRNMSIKRFNQTVLMMGLFLESERNVSRSSHSQEAHNAHWPLFGYTVWPHKLPWLVPNYGRLSFARRHHSS
jgi:hypothetical protein